MPPVSVSASSSASASLAGNGAQWGGFDGSGWVVNMAGSGTANQSASGGGINWTYVLIAAAAWFLLKK
jgi:hypothetical protein